MQRSSLRLPGSLLLVLLAVGCSGGLFDGDGNDVDDQSETTSAGENDTDGQAAAASTPDNSVSGGRDSVRETLVVAAPLTVGPIRDKVVVSGKVEART